jgi:hypothetical protein
MPLVSIRARVVRVLIASPGDVVERDLIETAIHSLNHERAPEDPVLLPVRWESDVPAVHPIAESIQEQIDRWIVESAEIAVVVFWKRIGQRNTVHELEKLVERGAVVMVAVCERDSPTPREPALDQYLGELKSSTILCRYRACEELVTQIQRSLRQVLPRLGLRHPCIGRWLEVKQDESARPYSVIEFKGADGRLAFTGRSYDSQGVAGDRWADEDDRLFEDGSKVFHVYNTQSRNDLVCGTSEYDFAHLNGSYHQISEAAEHVTARIEFDLLALTDDFEAFHLGPKAKEPERARRDGELVARVHQYRLQPRVILVGGTAQERRELLDEAEKRLQSPDAAEPRYSVLATSFQERWIEHLERESKHESDLSPSEAQGMVRGIVHKMAQAEWSLGRVRTRTPLLMHQSGVEGIAILRARGIPEDPALRSYAVEQHRYTFRVLALPSPSSSDERTTRLSEITLVTYQDLGYATERLAAAPAKRREQLADALEAARSFDPLRP